MKNKYFISTILFITGFFSSGYSQIPEKISYQGVLTNEDGILVTDSTYELTFMLFDTETGGDELWSETHDNVNVIGGLFNILLGSINPLNIPFNSPYWLSISIEGNETLPRIELAASPYSMNARSVTGNTGFGIVPIGTILPWHKSLDGTPDLPEGWAECNGQVVSDDSSPYNGQTMPDLNNSGRFIRGGSESGTVQDDNFKSHTHGLSGGVTNHTGNTGLDGEHDHSIPIKKWAPGSSGYIPVYESENTTSNIDTYDSGDHNHSMTHPHSDTFSIDDEGDSETRPINMSVVWIMRIR